MRQNSRVGRRFATAVPAGHPAGSGWRLPKFALFIATVCLVGVLVLLYPTAAAWVSSVQQAQQLTTYGQGVSVLAPSVVEGALTEAQRYNAALSGTATFAANERKPEALGTGVSNGFEYNKLLASDQYGTMGRIKIPSIDVDLPIFHGTSDNVLAQGVGHLEGTALPVGGVGTHAVLTGHRGLPTSTLFTNLDKVKVGDTFTVTVFQEVLTYRVVDTKVVDPDQTSALDPVPGKDLVTLVTCTPLGINSQRILVTGERVLPTPARDAASAAAAPAGPGFPWWIVVIGCACLLLSTYVWASGRSRTSPEPADSGPDVLPLPTLSPH
ncbi:class C sortase [Psychromicrobium xiongbiense]|uniref:class C sortase n=1 Tax=Psychromicrobium xiongbiense TaxID=3051184 RepID=UPI00255399AC|nr:class C sortase [Psychromicrobium sp. YIM S02556]